MEEQCLRTQRLVGAGYFTAFHSQILISETQRRRIETMERKKKPSYGGEEEEFSIGRRKVTLIKLW